MSGLICAGDKSPVTTGFKPPVFGKYTQSAVFSYEIRLDMQGITKTPQIDEYSVFLAVCSRFQDETLKLPGASTGIDRAERLAYQRAGINSS